MPVYVFDAILTPDEGDCFSVEIPALPGCITCGDTYVEAISMAVDAARTWIASALRHGETIPSYRKEDPPAGSERAYICFDADPSWVVEGPVMSAAQAARELGVSAGRVTHMLDSGLLEGYRSGRRTYVTCSSVESRKNAPKHCGRPRLEVAMSQQEIPTKSDDSLQAIRA